MAVNWKGPTYGNGAKHTAKTIANGQPPKLNRTANPPLGVSGPSVTIQT